MAVEGNSRVTATRVGCHGRFPCCSANRTTHTHAFDLQQQHPPLRRKPHNHLLTVVYDGRRTPNKTDHRSERRRWVVTMQQKKKKKRGRGASSRDKNDSHDNPPLDIGQRFPPSLAVEQRRHETSAAVALTAGYSVGNNSGR